MINPIPRLYRWVLQQSDKPYAEVLLVGLAFIEASVFPIPPDVLLVPMIIAQRSRAFRYATLVTLGSVMGALLGYAIGAFAMMTLGHWIITTYHLESAFQHFQDLFKTWGVWIIVAKGLTPIPFKIVTIACGIAHFNLVIFILTCCFTRGARFFAEAWIFARYGAPLQEYMERYITWVAMAFLVAIIIGFYLVIA